MGKKRRFKIFNKYLIGNKEFWNSPIICEGCNKEVKSISRNPFLEQNKWLCQECQNKDGSEKNWKDLR